MTIEEQRQQIKMRHWTWRPRTKIGVWAVWLSAAFLALSLANSLVLFLLPDDRTWVFGILPIYSLLMLAAGLIGGLLALVAMLRHDHRSRLVWLALLVGLWAFFVAIG